MTNDELLIPRKKVMIDFPQWSTFKHKKGDILTKKGIHWIGKGTARGINENEIDNYPEIFRDMSWWEERKEEDMPEYVKHIATNSIDKVVKWDMETLFGFTYLERKIGCDLALWKPEHGYIPATKEEYESQKIK
jgi:hypothetical protein